jgi:uncharacterized protein (TIGR02421 family)
MSATSDGPAAEPSTRAGVAAGAHGRLSPAFEFEAVLGELCKAARLLPAVTAQNAASERARLVQALEQDGRLLPAWALPLARLPRGAFRALETLRARLGELPAPELYAARLDELELDLSLLDALGDSRRVLPLAARRFGTGDERVPTAAGAVRLSDHARQLLAETAPDPEPRVLPPDSADEASLGGMVRALGRLAGLPVRVQLEPRLAAGAATGDMTVYVATRHFGVREALRLAVHEVLGHVVASANGRLQPLRILEWGTAGSFADQEGVALYLEHVHGLLDGERLRLLAGRVLATELLHARASFEDTVRVLHHEHGFRALEAVVLGERAFRGGGVARDAGYLGGFLRVRAAIDAGQATLDELRSGRLSLAALPALRELRRLGLARAPRYRPNFSRSFFATRSGTAPDTSPPSDAASFTRLELT